MPGGLVSFNSGPRITIDGSPLGANSFSGVAGVVVNAANLTPEQKAYSAAIKNSVHLTDPGVTKDGLGIAVASDKEVTDVNLHLGDKKSIADDRFTIRRENGTFATLETEIKEENGHTYIYAQVDLDGDGDIDTMRQEAKVTKNAAGQVTNIDYGALEYIYKQ